MMSKSEDGDDMNQTKAIRVPKVAKKGERERMEQVRSMVTGLRERT